ncbi:MAG: M15 family metallopeptidase [Saprospiraceae bacterium]|nr:MAG: peptidase m15d vanx d-ala-d-ala dipeptidase [Bacteroidetes bacterium OLB9]MCO6463755.1 M15 family metallopeptidase [Saprospiraceae bacterium]
MINPRYILLLFSLLLIVGCKNDIKPADTNRVTDKTIQPSEQKETTEPPATEEEFPEAVEPIKIADDIAAKWVELSEKDGFTVDVRYATTHNFTKKKIYDCGKCYLHPEASENLIKVQQDLQKRFGYSIKLFDCYRPRAYQQRLWDAVPDPDYVTPPQKGSMHSRGLAVDLTIVDKDGKELDMGTPYDFFGEEAHYSYNHSDAVKRNRWILKSTMEKYGFKGIRTEWWHFSYRSVSYPLDEWIWPCD